MKKEHLCMAKERVRESITSLKIRVGDPPKLPASCPVCNCPFGSKEEGLMRVVRCARCGVKHHEPCFWRVLPLEEWVEYVEGGCGDQRQGGRRWLRDHLWGVPREGVGVRAA